MGTRIDLEGQRFGRLTVLRIADRKDGVVRWTCLCDCGTTKDIRSQKLRIGSTRSCGCFQRDVAGTFNAILHGHASRGVRTPEYMAWMAMLARCRNPKHKEFKHYGGRGITVCERWLKFENFLEDMKLKPIPELSIDRKNNNGNYEPGNCRWATKEEQQSNRRNNKWIESGGERRTLAQWERHLGFLPGRITQRLKRGWSEEEAITP